MWVGNSTPHETQSRYRVTNTPQHLKPCHRSAGVEKGSDFVYSIAVPAWEALGWPVQLCFPQRPKCLVLPSLDAPVTGSLLPATRERIASDSSLPTWVEVGPSVRTASLRLGLVCLGIEQCIFFCFALHFILKINTVKSPIKRKGGNQTHWFLVFLYINMGGLMR